MAQVNYGVRAVLAHSAIYSLFQGMVGANRMQREIVRTYLRPWTGARVLDIGCGPATILDYMWGSISAKITSTWRGCGTAIARHFTRATRLSWLRASTKASTSFWPAGFCTTSTTSLQARFWQMLANC